MPGDDWSDVPQAVERFRRFLVIAGPHGSIRSPARRYRMRFAAWWLNQLVTDETGTDGR